MLRRIGTGLLLAAIGAGMLGGCKKETPEKTEAAPAAPIATENEMTGEELFKQHCAVCHPDGGNIVKPDKTLDGKALAASNIVKPKDIVKVMRDPGPGMNRFDEATIPDEEAKKIGKYILETFK